MAQVLVQVRCPIVQTVSIHGMEIVFITYIHPSQLSIAEKTPPEVALKQKLYHDIVVIQGLTFRPLQQHLAYFLFTFPLFQSPVFQCSTVSGGIFFDVLPVYCPVVSCEAQESLGLIQILMVKEY